MLKWPAFKFCTTSSGIPFYKMIESNDPKKSGVLVTLPIKFMESSFRFFHISQGDLVCIRFCSADNDTKYVFHMVVNHVEMDRDKVSKAAVYMKFVLDDSNYISQKVYQVIQQGRASYEVQLINSSLPLRYRKQNMPLRFLLSIYPPQENLSLSGDNACWNRPCQEDCTWRCYHCTFWYIDIDV